MKLDKSFNINIDKISFKTILDKVLKEIYKKKGIHFKLIYNNDVVYHSSNHIYKTNYIIDNNKQ